MKINIDIVNCKIENTSEPFVQIKKGSFTLLAYGDVDYIADYDKLKFFEPQELQIENMIRSILFPLEIFGKATHALTELVGNFIIIILENNILRYIYNSGSLANPIYYSINNNLLKISTDWVDTIQYAGDIKYSLASIARFLDSGTTSYDTFIENTSVLKPYSFYSYESFRLHLLTHLFPGFHTIDNNNPPKYGINDFLRALSAYSEHLDSSSVAYSSGVESRVMAKLYRNSVKEYLTMQYQSPHRVAARKENKLCLKKLLDTIM